MKVIYYVILILFITVVIAQQIEPEITMERKKLIILTNDKQNSQISQKITQIVSSTATQLNRYIVIDRNQLDKIIKEQKLQHSGVVDQEQAIEIGKVVAANEALLINVHNFGQKGVPTDEQEENEEKEEPKTGMFGWVVKEIVKAGIDKEMENVERYPNNIHTVIDAEIQLIDIETGQSISSFAIHADHMGGVKVKSLSEALKQVRSQTTNKLKSLYLLSTEVLDAQGEEIILLLGEDMGIKRGTLFEISTLDKKRKVRDRDITVPGTTVGFIEIKKVSADASEGRILRKWDDIEPGYQAHEIIDGVFTGGIRIFYGNIPNNIRLCLSANINPFNRFGGAAYGNIGTVQDSREDSDFQFGFGFDLNYRIIRTSPFSFGGVLSLPFDFHVRSDDGNQGGEVHSVFLPVFNPRLGIQSEIMVSPKLDLVIRFEYIISSVEGSWSYIVNNSNNSHDESTRYDANWDNRGAPDIDYQSWMLGLGIRSTFFSSFTFK